jgi:hypothetical protein
VSNLNKGDVLVLKAKYVSEDVTLDKILEVTSISDYTVSCRAYHIDSYFISRSHFIDFTKHYSYVEHIRKSYEEHGLKLPPTEHLMTEALKLFPLMVFVDKRRTEKYYKNIGISKNLDILTGLYG